MIAVPIYVINLRHRADRKKSLLSHLSEIGVDSGHIRWVEAQRTLRNGAIGCAASHAFALSRFLFESDAPFCWIIEDDFRMNDKDRISEIGSIILRHEEWDVVLLASNVAYAIHASSITGAFRVHNAQTASAYLVTRRYAPTLIRLFFETAERISNSSLFMDKIAQKHFYALDIAWKDLQIRDRFLAMIPPLSHQCESFSDIEQKSVAYGV